MATGTEGPDYLVNDTSVEFDFINGLGGDDTIQIFTSSDDHSVTVDGGTGFDTMTLSGYLWGMGTGWIDTGQGTLSPRNYISYSGIERLVIRGIALSHSDQYGGVFPVYLTTGSTIDHLTISSLVRFNSSPADVHVDTGNGGDVIILTEVGIRSTVRGGSGNDLIDLTAVPFIYGRVYGEGGDDILLSSRWNDLLDGGIGDDFLNFRYGDSSNARGGSGADIIYFGGTLDSRDRVDGGSETDRLILQGDYGSGLVLTPNVQGIEIVSLLSSSDSTYSGGHGGLYDYVLTTHDSNFASGVQARIDGAGLLAGEDLTFDGSAETDARFLVYGGKGADRITGSRNDDLFFFGDEGRFAPGDVVKGGAGDDNLVLRGSYTINFTASGYAGALQDVETLTLSSASDVRYAAGGTEFDYYVIWADSLLGAGRTITVSGALLRSNETLTFDGTREKDGSFHIFAGAANDQLFGGRGSDLIFGGLGGDRMLGNGGNDVFRYDKAAESTASARDSIRDFNLGDRVDLSRIDASTLASGDQAFTFIDTAAFGNKAGQLRVESQREPVWLVQGDIDGDGAADFELTLTVVDFHPLTGADFIL